MSNLLTDSDTASAAAPALSNFIPRAGHEQDLPPLFPLAELALRPWMPKKNGKPIHFTTLLRWATRERARGFKLKTLRVGGALCTCDVWAMQFFEALTNKAQSVPARGEAVRARQLRRAEEQLAQAGI